jgi:hypothetical protein
MNGNTNHARFAAVPKINDGAFNLDEFAKWARVGRTAVYMEAAAGRLIVSKIGRRSVVTYANASAWLNSLPTRQPAV